ncbi:MAG: ferritin-like domain-containing protein [Blastochloris viridis]|uniref:Ferritin-like domain-containing protein n=1 Tax=Blastochloris viridis TaxID=1079 RepID=A0A6N4RBG9_BLAVI|nr:MAG: ferritin-like domain-containing protein [Blastochloris viridis]
MADKTLTDLFLHNLKDIYYAEKQIYKTLPKMAKAAQSEELKDALESHREETAGQIERIEEVFKILEKRAQGVVCEAIQGIIEEGKEAMDDFGKTSVGDLAIAGSGRAVEHYEMARYSILCDLAKQLGMKDAAKLLDQNLQEEVKADKLLTQLSATLVPSETTTRKAA